MLIAHVTDIHMRAGREPAPRWRDMSRGGLDAIVEGIAAFDPPIDAVALTGDLADPGTVEDYALLEPLRRLRMPLLPIPGNHDLRRPMRAAFDLPPSPGQEGSIQYAVDVGPLRVVALDTLLPGEPQGQLCAGRLAWAGEALAEAAERPTLLLMHHPPIPLGISGMDAMRLRDGADELGALVRRHPNLVGILCGHYHRPVVARWHGVPLLVAASPALQLGLHLLAGEAPAVDEPYGMFIHRWTPESGLVTHTHSVPLPR